ncbi:hypothetical protein SAY87_029211 [Trapa incisa]|uniref:MBD domain-containing protein n=1 Tax=Trapa incisa TaxID=236973 RepID=A0AAN7KVH6_9MYRT|nr:hypothetical protein SAY87_029211 [Trapa incisa]
MASSVERGDEEVVSLDLPAPAGWTKKYVFKKGGTPKKNSIIFTSPTGEEFSNKKSLDKYLKSHPGGPPISEFNWGTGETPRRSARISEKAKTTSPPEIEPPKKRRKTLSLKEAKVSEETKDVNMEDAEKTEKENPKAEDGNVEEAPEEVADKIDEDTKVEDNEEKIEEDEKPKEEDITKNVEQPQIEEEKMDNCLGRENKPFEVKEDMEKEENKEPIQAEHESEPKTKAELEIKDKAVPNGTEEQKESSGTDIVNNVEEDPEEVVDEIGEDTKVENNEEKTDEDEKPKEEYIAENVEQPQIEEEKVDNVLGKENKPFEVNENVEKEENEEPIQAEHESEPKTKAEFEIKDKVVSNGTGEQKESSGTDIVNNVEEAPEEVVDKIGEDTKVENNEEKTEEGKKPKQEDITENVEQPRIEEEKVDYGLGKENKPFEVNEYVEKEENKEPIQAEHESETKTKAELEIKDMVIPSVTGEQKESSGTHIVNKKLEGEPIENGNYGEEVEA